MRKFKTLKSEKSEKETNIEQAKALLSGSEIQPKTELITVPVRWILINILGRRGAWNWRVGTIRWWRKYHKNGISHQA
jgi:hypothetical protein